MANEPKEKRTTQEVFRLIAVQKITEICTDATNAMEALQKMHKLDDHASVWKNQDAEIATGLLPSHEVLQSRAALLIRQSKQVREHHLAPYAADEILRAEAAARAVNALVTLLRSGRD